MTRNEFIAKLSEVLKKLSIPDAEEIINEYEQHFAFKMADGYSEEEIAAKLGDPVALASQFQSEGKKHGGRKITAVIGLGFIDIFAGMFFVLLLAWEAVMAVFSLSTAVVALCLLVGTNPGSLLPPMPYGIAIVFALSLAALAVLAAVGAIYFAAFIRQLMRAYGRFHKNTLDAASGRAPLPSLPIYPRLPGKANRALRFVALVSLALFTATFVLGAVLSMLISGSLEFWHAWGWFGY